MRDIDVRPVRRTTGRQSLERRLRALLIATNRYARTRAVTRSDQRWAAEVSDTLTSLLGQANPCVSDQVQRDAVIRRVLGQADPR